MPTATFDQVLSGKRATRRLGSVRLRYDGQLLIGQTVPALDARTLWPDGLLVGAAIAGALSLAALVVPPLRGNIGWSLGFACLAAVSTWIGARAAVRRRGLSFVVNFDRHIVRIDWPAAARSLEVPFADARVSVAADASGALSLELSSDALKETLIRGVPEQDAPALESIARLMRDAFAPGPPTAPEA